MDSVGQVVVAFSGEIENVVESLGWSTVSFGQGEGLLASCCRDRSDSVSSSRSTNGLQSYSSTFMSAPPRITVA